jgi:hypothetical protein
VTLILVAGIEYEALLDVNTTMLVKPPEDPGVADVHALPFDVSMLPVVPGAVKPVPPSDAGRGVVMPVIAGVFTPLVPLIVTAMMFTRKGC